MPSSIPSSLSPYFQACFLDPSLTLVTSVLSASANWLIVRLLHVALYGVNDEGRDLRSSEDSLRASNNVVFLSFLRSKETWSELAKKAGLDFASSSSSKRLAYVDGLASNHRAITNSTDNSIRPKSLDLYHVLESITTARQALSSAHSSNKGDVLMIDGLDFLLASQPTITPLHLSQFLLSMRQHFTQIILTSSADSPLLHNSDPSATALEQDHATMLRMLSHQSSLVMQLRPLETGIAKDISGVIQICKGGASSASVDGLADVEWLYHIQNDGTLKAWGRGEQKSF